METIWFSADQREEFMIQEGSESLKRLLLARRIADSYKQIRGISSVAVGGSTAIGSAYVGSDLDMWSTYSKLPDPQETQEITRKLLEKHNNEPQPNYVMHGHVNAFRLDGIDVIIMLGDNDSLQQVPDKLDQLMGTPDEQFVAEYYYMVVLHDPKGVWKQIKARLSDYPTDIGAKIILTKLEELVRIVKDKIPKALTTGNVFFASELKVASLDEYLRLLFALNKLYYKRLIDVGVLLSQLEVMPNACKQRLITCAREDSLSKVRGMVLNLVKDTLPLIETVYPSIDLSESYRQLGSVA